jgi:hypothetical protein
VHFCYGGNYT